MSLFLICTIKTIRMIRIGNQEYFLKYTVRGLFVYEQITGTTFSPDKLLNEYTLLYAILIACNEGFCMTFEDLINACDEDPAIFIEFRKWLIGVLKQKAILVGAEVEESSEGVKKKD